MTLIYTASNADTAGGHTVASTLADTFDPVFCEESIRCSAVGEAFPVKFVAPAADMNLAFAVRMPSHLNTTNTSLDGHWIAFYDTADTLIGKLDITDARPRAYVSDGGANDQNSATYSLGVDSGFYQYVIRLQVTPTDITMRIFVGGAQVAMATCTNATGITAVARASFDHDDCLTTSSGSNASIYYSEIRVMDGESLIDTRMHSRTALADGHHTDWAGGAAMLHVAGDGTRAASDTAGERMSSTLAAYGGPAAPSGVRAVALQARLQRGGSGPAQARQFLRITGTDYDGADVTPDDVTFAPELQVWDNNPATLAAWDTADLGFEIGLQSRP